ncbi:hypothetical protein MNEG_7174, partial [Monoraphidium neglectum]
MPPKQRRKRQALPQLRSLAELPSPLLGHIAGSLEEPKDRNALRATCRQLRLAVCGTAKEVFFALDEAKADGGTGGGAAGMHHFASNCSLWLHVEALRLGGIKQVRHPYPHAAWYGGLRAQHAAATVDLITSVS